MFMKTNFILGRRSFQRSIRGGFGLGRYTHLHCMGSPVHQDTGGTDEGGLLTPVHGSGFTVEIRRTVFGRSTWTVVTYYTLFDRSFQASGFPYLLNIPSSQFRSKTYMYAMVSLRGGVIWAYLSRSSAPHERIGCKVGLGGDA